MPVMSRVEQAFCRSAPWRLFASRVVLPWALDRERLRGEVLELGGGSGAMASAMLGGFPHVSLTVTDFDAAMTAAAARRLAPFGERVRVEQADAAHLHYDDASFDIVTSFIMLHHVIDWENAVAEAVRVLRPGGVYVGYDLLQSGVTRLTHHLDRSPHRLMTPNELGRSSDRSRSTAASASRDEAFSYVSEWRSATPRRARGEIPRQGRNNHGAKIATRSDHRPGKVGPHRRSQQSVHEWWRTSPRTSLVRPPGPLARTDRQLAICGSDRHR